MRRADHVCSARPVTRFKLRQKVLKGRHSAVGHGNFGSSTVDCSTAQIDKDAVPNSNCRWRLGAGEAAQYALMRGAETETHGWLMYMFVRKYTKVRSVRMLPAAPKAALVRS